jgi:hypothetical protein
MVGVLDKKDQLIGGRHPGRQEMVGVVPKTSWLGGNVQG